MYTGIAEVMQANNYSSFTRLLRVTVYVLRFIHHLKVLDTGNPVLTTSQAEELTQAKQVWIRFTNILQ